MIECCRTSPRRRDHTIPHDTLYGVRCVTRLAQGISVDLSECRSVRTPRTRPTCTHGTDPFPLHARSRQVRRLAGQVTGWSR
eukprot:1465472-Prymnesium_polylepis.1